VAGSTRCRTTTPARCTASAGCLGAHASCCDSCGTIGCNPTTTTTLGPRNCGNYVIDADEVCDGEPFCDGCFAQVRVCCQFTTGGETCSYDMERPFICDPGYSNQQAVYGVLATGTPGACPAGSYSDGPCGEPMSFLPTSICCAEPGVCTTEVVSDTRELAFRIFDDECYEIVDGNPVPTHVVGTCDSPTGTCTRTH
jgi:hypothetical protein